MPENTARNPLKIFIHSLEGAGHMNACVGLAQALKSRGHDVYFVIVKDFAGEYEKYELKQILLDKKPITPAQESNTKENPFKSLVELVKKTNLLSSQSSYEKMKEMVVGSMFGIQYDAAAEFNPQIEEALKREKPDLFIMDSLLCPPAVMLCKVPWMLVASANPLLYWNSEQLPPGGSGYPTDSDPATWQEFRKLGKMTQLFGKYQEKLNAHFGFESIDEEGQTFISKLLNIYGFPEELDYHDLIEIPENFTRVDAFCRDLPEPFELPEDFPVGPEDKLVYVSLGSMGSIDVELMKRILSVLAQTSHKYIVSRGPLHEEYSLPPNCWGLPYLPQTKILPLVDLVITHGGNNTVTETFSMGKPMIVMPLFGDQYDNAQRVQEKNYGIRIEPYSFEDSELINAINTLLNDSELKKRCEVAAERIRTSNSKEKVCERIEQVIAKLEKVK